MPWSRGTIHVLGATMVGWDAPLKIFSGMGRVQAMDMKWDCLLGAFERVFGNKKTSFCSLFSYCMFVVFSVVSFFLPYLPL